MTGPLLTAREVAELLGVSTETVLRWARRGLLPAIRLPGGAIRFQNGPVPLCAIAKMTPRKSSSVRAFSRPPA